jgi:hypothetical protein
MTEFYLDFETLGFNPDQDKIITIQYQNLDTKSGMAKGPLKILKEWELSEKEILREFLEILNPSNPWDFVPVGNNLRFELFFLQKRLREVLKIKLSDEWILYELPRIDIKSLIVMMNQGQFKGSSLDWLVKKEMDDGQIPKWYRQKDYSSIELFIAEETERFLHVYQYLKQKLPSLHVEYRPME